MEEGEVSSSAGEEDGGEEQLRETPTAHAQSEDTTASEALLLSALQEQLERDVLEPQQSTHALTTNTKKRKAVVKEEEEVEEQIPPEKLQLLGSPDAVNIREMLANPHLRQLLREVDSTSAPQRCLRRAMEIPVFVEFADECLRLCGLREGDSERLK